MPTPSRSEPPATDPHGALHALPPSRTSPAHPSPDPSPHPSPGPSSGSSTRRSARRAAAPAVVLPTLGALVAVLLTVLVGAPGAAPGDTVARPPVAPPAGGPGAAPRFGLVTTAWLDDDGDGLRGAAEGALAGVVVHLEVGDREPARHADGTPVRPRTTGSDGTVAFDDLADGVYRVRYVLPDGHRLTTAVAAAGRSDAGVDSQADAVDPSGSVGLSGPLPLTADVDGLDLPLPSETLAADRVARVSVGATPASQVLAG